MTTISGNRIRRLMGATAMMAVALLSSGCSGLFDVEDPQAFGDDDLNDPAILGAVANGAEGSLHQAFDDVLVMSGMLADELEDTSTWIDWRDVTLGRVRGDWPSEGAFSGPFNALMRARFAAQDAARRFETVLGADAATSPLMAQVQWVDGMADLLLGMNYCEAVLVPNGERATDIALIKQSITKLNTALASAQGADEAAWINTIRATRARAYLFDGQYDLALADASSIPDNFVKNAVFAEGSGVQQSTPGNQLHANRNRSAGVREMYWPRIQITDAAVTGLGFLKDHFDAAQLDRRMAVNRKGTALGVNNQTPHYGIEKYNDRAADITLLSKREMNLIEAEVFMRRGDFATMTDRLNRNRTRGGVALPPLPVATSAAQAQQFLLAERFAELFVEGHRLHDLNRFDLVTAVLGSGRAKKLPMSRTEILNNPNVPDFGAPCPAIS
jgi:hypothetical protein